MVLSMSRMEVSLCLLNGVVEDRRFLMMVSRGSYQVVQVQRMVLGFYRPQKDLSWAEKQAFKEEQKNLAPILKSALRGISRACMHPKHLPFNSP